MENALPDYMVEGEIDRETACGILGRSDRMVGDYAKAGKLKHRYIKGKTRPIMVFVEADVRAYKEKLETGNTEIVEGVETGNQNSSKPESGSRSQSQAIQKAETRNQNPAVPVSNFINIEASQFPALAAHIIKAAEESRVAQVPIENKPLLTFPEAAQLTGLSERSLRVDAKDGKLKAVRQGRADRISRKNLDKYLDEVHG